MKINVLKVVEGVALLVGVGVSIAQGWVADKKLDIKIDEKLAAKALENK
jgi:phage gp29-like protein